MKKTTIKRILSVMLAMLMLLPLIASSVMATDENYYITNQPTETCPTVETNKNEDVSGYKWYKLEISEPYRVMLPPPSLDVIYEGDFVDGKWISDEGYINITFHAGIGDTVKVTVNEGFDGNVSLYNSDIYFEKISETEFIYIADRYYFDVEIYSNDENEHIEATVQVISNDVEYSIEKANDFNEADGTYFSPDVDDGYYDGEKWVSDEENGEQELDVEFELNETGYIITAKMNEGFVGYATIEDRNSDAVIPLELTDGKFVYTVDDEFINFELIINSDEGFTAEITIQLGETKYTVIDESDFNNKDMTYVGAELYYGKFDGSKFLSEGEYSSFAMGMNLEEFSTLTVKMSEGFNGDVCLYRYSDESEIRLEGENGIYTFTSESNMSFELVAENAEAAFSAEIFINKTKRTLLEDQTTKTLTIRTNDSYYAEIEFNDGTVLTSDIFKISKRAIFDTNGGTPLDSLIVSELTEIGKTEREGFILEGWYLDEELNQKVELPLDISGLVNLYAKWTKCDHAASTQKPTCTENAECTVCKGEYKATGHSYNLSYTASNDKHYFECSICGAKQSEADHSFGEWTVTKYAERKTQGEQKRACTACGYTESRALDALGGISNGAIVGIILGSSALLSLLAIGLWFILKRSFLK